MAKASRQEPAAACWLAGVVVACASWETSSGDSSRSNSTRFVANAEDDSHVKRRKECFLTRNRIYESTFSFLQRSALGHPFSHDKNELSHRGVYKVHEIVYARKHSQTISQTAFEIRFFAPSRALTSCDKPTFALLLPLEGPPPTPKRSLLLHYYLLI
jgi:hypothetical protein